jgi:hypothetical protein
LSVFRRNGHQFHSHRRAPIFEIFKITAGKPDSDELVGFVRPCPPRHTLTSCSTLARHGVWLQRLVEVESQRRRQLCTENARATNRVSAAFEARDQINVSCSASCSGLTCNSLLVSTRRVEGCTVCPTRNAILLTCYSLCGRQRDAQLEASGVES